MIPVDSSRFRYVILAAIKKCVHKIKNMPLQPLQFFPVHDRWGNLLSFPVKSSVYFYSDRKPRAWKKVGNGPGVGKCPAPGQHKICKCPTRGTDKAGKCPAVARGGGLGVAGIDWCIIKLVKRHHEPRVICFTLTVFVADLFDPLFRFFVWTMKFTFS